MRPLAVAIGGDPLSDWLKVILSSKRAQAVLVGLIFALVQKYIPGLTEAQVAEIVGLIAAWVIGETVRPALKAPE